MEFTSQDRERIQNQFNAYYTTVLKYAARNIYRERKRLADREVSLSGLEEAPIQELLYTDEHSRKFNALGFDIAIKDELLAEALAMLTEKRRHIILLSYFIGMNDGEIGEALNLFRSTVQYQRTSTLKKLHQLLEAMRNEEI